MFLHRGLFFNFLFLLILSLEEISAETPASSSACSSSSPPAIIHQAACAALNGVMDGGRCFFIYNTTCNCTETWDLCAEHGGVLAQLHTQSEFDKVVHYVLNMYPLAPSDRILLWLALQHDPGYEVVSQCQDVANNTYWYDSAIEKNVLMPAASTWVKYYICNDTDINAGELFGFLQVNSAGGQIRDVDCNSRWGVVMPLCALNSYKQAYTKTDGICMTEQPLEIISGSLQPQTCADSCTSQIWCRSFNFIYDPVTCDNNGTCQLFSWSLHDTTKTAVDPGCIHYSYIP